MKYTVIRTGNKDHDKPERNQKIWSVMNKTNNEVVHRDITWPEAMEEIGGQRVQVLVREDKDTRFVVMGPEEPGAIYTPCDWVQRGGNCEALMCYICPAMEEESKMTHSNARIWWEKQEG